jgi:hypothetical protein
LALHPIPVTAEDGSKSHTSPLFLIQDQTRQSCLDELIEALRTEPVPTVRKKLCDCIAEVGRTLIQRAIPWPALGAAVAQCVHANEPDFRESAFRILAIVPKLLMHEDVVDMAIVTKTFENSLSDNEVLHVRVGALNAAVCFLMEAQVEAKTAFNPLMVQMLNVLPSLLAQENETSLTEAFTSLIELAASLPRLFRPILPQLLAFSLSILTNKQLEEGTRHSCLELLMTLVDEAPAMIRKKTPEFCQNIIPICLEMMSLIEDEATWHATDNIEESDDSDESHVIGEQAMDRIARKIGATTVTPVAFTLIPQYLQSSNWNQRHAALMAVSAIGEGCHKLLSKELAKVVSMVVPYTADAHPRVRYAACNCIGQLSTDFAPTFQKKYHSQIIPALMTCMNDVQNPRVQAHGAAAMVNFCEDVDQGALKQYLEVLFAKLVSLSSSPKIYVQEQAITTMATVADAAEDTFAQYYDAVMPALKNILNMPNHKELRLLRGKAMECATLIAMAVKKPVFIKDAQAFLEILGRIQAEVTDPDDPQISYLMHSWARLCTVLNEDFIPYLPIVMPPLLQGAQMKPEVALLDHEESADAYSPDEGWQTAVVDGKRICIRTSMLDEKYSTIEMISCYARNLGTGFRPYVAQAMDILVKQLEFYYHDGVRQISCSSIPHVLAAAQDSDEILPIWALTFDKLLKLLPNELDVEFLQQAFSTINESLLLLNQRGITQPQAESLARVSEEVLKEYFERVKDRDSKRKDEDYDPDQEEDLEEEAAFENMVLTEIAKTMQTLLKVFGVAVLPLFESIMGTILMFLKEDEEDLLLVGLSAFDDLVEFTGPAAAKYLPAFGDRVLQSLTHSAPSVRQSSAYGVGMAARVGGDLFQPLCLAALGPLVQVLQATDARDDDNVMATENAVAAIGRILRSPFCILPDSQREELLRNWVQSMPLVYDEDESPQETAFLCDLAEANHPVVVASSDHIIRSFLELLYQGTHEGEPPLQSRILSNVKQILSSLPPDHQTQLWNSLEDDKKASLKEKGYF